MLVYQILNTVNGKVYIGKTIQKLSRRWNDHVAEANNGSTRALCRAIRKYGRDAFVVSVLATCTTDAELNETEIRLIAEKQSLNTKYGYNMTPGGECDIFANNPHAEAIKDKLRGRYYSEEFRQKISKATRGKKKPAHTAEHNEKIRQAMIRSGHKPPGHKPGTPGPMLGRKHTDEARAKMSAAHRGAPRTSPAQKQQTEKHRQRMADPANWPNYVPISKEQLESCIRSGMALEDIAATFKVSLKTVHNKITQYWSVTFRQLRYAWGLNKTPGRKQRKAGPTYEQAQQQLLARIGQS